MRKIEIAAGVLFLLSTASFLIGSGMLDPILHRSDLLYSIDSNRTSIFTGLILELINALAVVGIGLLLQSVLHNHHKMLALGYFASRIMESILLIVSLTCPLILLVVSKKPLSAGTSAESYLQTIGSFAVEAHFLLFEIAMIVLSLGSLLFCYILYQSRLVPRLLSLIGFLGYAGLLASSSLSIAGLDIGSVLYIPGAIFELVLPIWLIVKGFRRSGGDVPFTT
ncbi:DUF4386 domain-containing protein [Paenibacillus sp. YPG26]|uniref:DUF4386 domain-containing protein n=1 Tax=Paenibacillus sp. YPG26 TaxID=2878915 RepID=UPI00203CB2FE|nr:DUF4386 domain-containing protein [Paenibacillus sp. YPG26]USB33151.1 DUF4386 domain-containing protein [Paenibacillus sp. YPG26]